MIASFLQYLMEIPLRFRRVTRSHSYVPQIDGMRFLAIMPVLFWHSCIRAAKTHPEISVTEAVYWLPHGHAGVELFFFISGYIIAYPFLAGRPPAIRAFYSRRVLRLEPPYFLAMTLAYLVLAITGYKPAAGEALSYRGDISLFHSLLASLGYVHWLVFGSPSTINPPTWSLEVEIQFYLLSPLLLWAYGKMQSFRLRAPMLLLVALALMASSGYLDALHGRYALHRWTLLGHAAPFLVGIVICDFAVCHDPFSAKPKPWFDLAFCGGIILWLATAMFWLDERADFGIGMGRDAARLTGIAAIYFGGAYGVFARRFLGLPWISFIGGMCYSIYLIHVMVMQGVYVGLGRILPHLGLGTSFLVWFMLLAPTSICAGTVYYLFVERACMNPDWPKLLLRKSGFGGRALIQGEKSGSAPSQRIDM